ncbi:ABC transporter permease [Streptomyces lasalocidi]
MAPCCPPSARPASPCLRSSPSILLVYVFAVRAGALPAGGYTPLTEDPWEWGRHLVLPCLSLGLVQGAVLTRYVRSAVLSVQHQHFMRTARAKGVRRWAALCRHGLPNAAVPVLTVLGLQLSTLLVGAIVVERVFVIPGLGDLLLRAVADRDLLLVQGVVTVLVVAVLVVNLVTDVLYRVLDPRLRSR